jgi:hypothetical protein
LPQRKACIDGLNGELRLPVVDSAGQRNQQLDQGRGMFGQTGFFARRWRGEVPLPVVFWRDMLGIATFINLLASFMALILASQGVDLRIAVALHFAPIAYNMFLFMTVWRSPQCTVFKKAFAFAWLAVMTIV